MNVLGKIGEGTFGVVYLAQRKDRPRERLAIKVFKPTKDGEGVSTTTIREIGLLRELEHENIVRVDEVHISRAERSLSIAFDYADHDLQQIIRWHVEKLGSQSISQYTIKSLLWQILNGLNFLHMNWIVHRDMKPHNILVMGSGDEVGQVKIADFGLARIFQDPLRPLADNGVVVTIWYRAPELLLGAQHYTHAVDVWAAGCIFAELVMLRPLFQGVEVKSPSNAFQKDQLMKIFSVLGVPTEEAFPLLSSCPHWRNNVEGIQGLVPPCSKSLPEVSGLTHDKLALDLLRRMLEYDPNNRITAAEALEHEYFQTAPLPGRNAFSEKQQGSKQSPYPTRAMLSGSKAPSRIRPGQPLVDNYPKRPRHDLG